MHKGGKMRYWKRLNLDGSIKTVESYSHDLDIDGAIEVSKKELDEYIASLPAFEPEPTRNLAAEIDEIKAKVTKLEADIRTI